MSKFKIYTLTLADYKHYIHTPLGMTISYPSHPLTLPFHWLIVTVCVPLVPDSSTWAKCTDRPTRRTWNRPSVWQRETWEWRACSILRVRQARFLIKLHACFNKLPPLFILLQHEITRWHILPYPVRCWCPTPWWEVHHHLRLILVRCHASDWCARWHQSECEHNLFHVIKLSWQAPPNILMLH